MLWHDPPNHATTYSSIIQNATPLEQVIVPSLMDEYQQIQKACWIEWMNLPTMIGLHVESSS